jgi:hypothetical protein
MRKKNSFDNSLFYIAMCFCCVSCQLKEAQIESKNKCYRQELENLVRTPLYVKCHTKFQQTIDSLKTNTTLFNLSFEEINVDTPLFLKKSDSTECLVLLLIRNKDGSGDFGESRTFYGKRNGNNWSFVPGMSFSYDKDYLRMYTRNDFSNISELAVHSVLTAGNSPLLGCKLDDHYWFVELRE